MDPTWNSQIMRAEIDYGYEMLKNNLINKIILPVHKCRRAGLQV